MSVEEENCQLREVQWAQEEQIVQDGEWIWDLERSMGTFVRATALDRRDAKSTPGKSSTAGTCLLSTETGEGM